MTIWHCLYCDVSWDSPECGVCWSCGKGRMILPWAEVIVLRSKSLMELEKIEKGKYIKEEGYSG